jgi:hypothetical protein
LFEYILSEHARRGGDFGISTKALAQVALALRHGNRVAEVERCPHCDGHLRTRPLVSNKLTAVVNEWIAKARADARG